MHTQIFHHNTQKLFAKLSASSIADKYDLIGGTALALYIGHRESTDLDLVSYDTLTDLDISRIYSLSDDMKLSYQSAEQLDVFVDDVKLTLLSYRRRPLFPVQKFENINIRDIRDIASSKAYTIGRRSEIKDYIDIYVLLSQGYISLLDLVEQASMRYKGLFSHKLFAKQLLLVSECEEYEIKFFTKDKITKDIMYKYFADIYMQIV